MSNFKQALKEVLKHEGGYVYDKKYDRGGETNFGITKATAEGYGYTGPMKEIPMSTVEDIYYNQYWLRIRADEITDYPLQVELFLAAVNCGVLRASKWFQRTLNLFQTIGSPTLQIDGIIGPKSIQLFKEVNGKDLLDIRFALKSLIANHYINICEHNETQKRFIRGWFNRIT